MAGLGDHFHRNTHLWIFGSRVDLNARGGDIDLYVETPETNVDVIYNKKLKFIGAIWRKIGEQKDVALKNGVKLV